MRNAFFNSLCEIAVKDERVVLLYADTGALVLDEFRKEHPDRCINTGISEQNMIGVASGLAMNHKIVYVYAIIPFVMMRNFEQIRVDVCYQNLPVKIIGIGAGIDYSTLGPTHHAIEDIALMRSLPGMTILSPSDDVMASALARETYDIPGPIYVRLDRTGTPLVHENGTTFSEGLSVLSRGCDLCLVATGRMVVIARQVATELKKLDIDAGVIDLYTIKPLNAEPLLNGIGDSKYVATLEEHSIFGGIGSAVAELLAENGLTCGFKRFGLQDTFCKHYGTRDYLLSQINLSAADITRTLLDWIRQQINR